MMMMTGKTSAWKVMELPGEATKQGQGQAQARELSGCAWWVREYDAKTDKLRWGGGDGLGVSWVELIFVSEKGWF